MAQSCEALATKAELEALKRELQPLKVQVAGIGYEVNGLGGKLIELVVVTTGAIGALKDRIAQAVGDIPALRARMARDLAALKAELDPRLRSLESTLRRISEQLPNFVTDRELAALREQLEANANELPIVYENRLAALANRLNAFIAEANSAIAQANSQIEQGNAAIDRANSEIRRLVGLLNEIYGSYTRVAGETAANNIAVAAINARIARIEQQIANINQSSIPDEADYNGSIQGLRSDVNYLQTAINSINAAREGDSYLIQGLGNDVRTALQSQTAIVSQINSIRQLTSRRLNDFEERINVIRNTLRGTVGSSYVQEQVGNLSKVVESKIASLESDFKQTGSIDEGKLNTLEQIISGRLNALNTNLAQEITRSERRSRFANNNTNRELTNVTNRTFFIDNRLSTTIDKVNEIEIANTATDEKIDALTVSVGTSINDLQDVDARLLARIDTLEDTASPDLTNVNSRLAAVEEGIELNEEQYGTLLTTITGVDTKIDRTNLGLTTLGTGISAYLLSRLAPALTQIQAQTAPLAQTLEREFAQVKTRVSPASVANAVKTGVCDTAKPGGCLGTGGNWQKGLMNNFGNILGAGNAALSGLILQLSQSTNAIVKRTEPIIKSINTKQDLLGNALKGFQDFSEKAWKATQFDKVLAIMNFVLATHNAMMLSRNLVSTLGEAASTTLRFLKVKSPTGGDIDVNQVIGTSITNYLNQIFGAANIAATKATFAKYNRILTAANGVMMGLRQIKDASIEAAEIGFGWVAKIGNAMKIQGMLEEDAFPWMKEQPGFRQHYQGFRNKVDNFDTAASQANAFVSTGVEVQQGITDSTTAFTELVKAIDEFDMEKTTVEGAAQLESESPLIDRLNLLKKEPDESPTSP
jgi:predicted  nucleic acid-binding Zn-ribbon protein